MIRNVIHHFDHSKLTLSMSKTSSNLPGAFWSALAEGLMTPLMTAAEQDCGAGVEA